jgi:hypothetical protein
MLFWMIVGDICFVGVGLMVGLFFGVGIGQWWAHTEMMPQRLTMKEQALVQAAKGVLPLP